MGDVVSVTDAIERAIVSPDPAVRSAAIRYRSLEQELQGLESFFSFYGRAQAESVGAPPSAAKSRTVPGGKVATEFIGRVRDLLVKRGEPLRTSQLYVAFYEEYPDQEKLDSEVFRQRLAKHRMLIQHIEGVGHWPADLPLPTAGGATNVAA